MFTTIRRCHRVAMLGPLRHCNVASQYGLSPEIGDDQTSVVTKLVCPTRATRSTSQVPTKWTTGWQSHLTVHGVTCRSPWVSRTCSCMWPNTNKRRLLMKSMIGGKPMRADTYTLVICWDQCMWRIWRWNFMWNASNVFRHKKVVAMFLRHIALQTSPRRGTDESWCSAEGRYRPISDLRKTWLMLPSWSCVLCLRTFVKCPDKQNYRRIQLCCHRSADWMDCIL